MYVCMYVCECGVGAGVGKDISHSGDRPYTYFELAAQIHPCFGAATSNSLLKGAIPIGWAGSRDDSDNIRSSRGSKGETSSYDKEVILIRDETLFQSNLTSTAKHVSEVVGVVVIRTRELRIYTPTQSKLASRLLQRRNSQNRNIGTLLGSPKSRGTSNCKRYDPFCVYSSGNLSRREDDGGR